MNYPQRSDNTSNKSFNPNKTTFYITSWSDAGLSVKQQLIDQGLPEENIVLLTERVSRPIALNKALLSCKTEYFGMADEDVLVQPNALRILTSTLDNNPTIGFVAAPVIQQTDKLTLAKPDLPEHSSDEISLEDISTKLWTFNFVIMRNLQGKVKFEEEFFGNQLLDWDLGLELKRLGYSSVADHRTSVSHIQTDYSKKSYAYHGVVARNRHIFMAKWRDRASWQGVKAYNAQNNNEIPSLEELTHWSEEHLFDYICQYDKMGLTECWWRPRFVEGQNISIKYADTFYQKRYHSQSQLFNPLVNAKGIKFT